MLRSALTLSCVLGTGCLDYLERFEDDDVDDSNPPPPQDRVICGDGQRERDEVCDDGNLDDGDGCSTRCLRDATVRVSWQFATLAGEPRTCPDGFDVAEVITRENPFAPAITRAFDCAAGTGDLVLEQKVPELVHEVQVLIKSATGELYGESATIDHLDIARRTESSHQIVTDAGRIRVPWTVWLGNQPTFCDGVTQVRVVVRNAAGTVFTKPYSCGVFVGVTELLPTGTYSVDVSAVRGTQTASTTLDGIAVPTGGRSVLTGSANLVY